ncbi:MAG: hypothetical protein NTZ74_05755 [Chloroflexi bacterium]|nr:hypothetical protein [Chloroflexota bacterium]
MKIVGAPIACKEGIKDTWRDVAEWAAGQLNARYGDKVNVFYFDPFDPECPTIPPTSRLPVVFVNDSIVSNGEKISIPLIRKKIEELNPIKD